MQHRYLLLLGACGCIQALQPPTVDGFFVHKHYIGPVKEQYNTSEHFFCTGGAVGQSCLLQACEHCKASDWCHSFGVMDQEKEKFKYVQMYRADFNESLPGHPRWTLYSKGNTPPPNPPPPPSPPAPKPSVAYCATKELAYNFSRALLARTSSSLAHVADDVFRALQLGAQCNQSREENQNKMSPKFSETHSTAKWPSHAATRIVDCQNGHDTLNDGLSLSSPLRSISRALQSLSQRGPSAAPGVVYIRAGTCYLQATIELNASTVGAGITIASYPGETATVSGGQLIEGLDWQLMAATPGVPPGVYRAVIPSNVSLSDFSTVFTKRSSVWRRAVRSRHPDGNPEENGLWSEGRPGYLPPSASKSLGAIRQRCDSLPPHLLCNVTVPHFTYGQYVGGKDQTAGYSPPFEPYWCGKWSGCRGVDYSSALSGSDPMPPLPTGEDAERLTIHSTRGTSDIWANFQWGVAGHDPDKHQLNFSRGGYQFPRGTTGMGWWFVDNAGVSALTSGLEWWFSPSTRSLYMRGNGTSLPTNIVATQLKTLVRASGTQLDPLPSVTLANLTFAHTEVTYLDPYETPSGGGYSVARRGAIEFTGCHSPRVEGCVLDGMGGNGILFSDYVRGAVVTDCDIKRVGDSGIVVLGSTHYCNGTGGDQPRGTLIHRNALHEVGLYGKQGTGVFQALAMATTITNNIVFNGPRSGILFNDGMGGGHRVESNLLFNLCRETTDHGPFNSWDRVPYVVDGHVGPLQTNITRNLIICNYQCTWPIDHDDGSNSYNDTFNALFYGGAKNYLGHDKHSIGNLYVSADNKPREGAGGEGFHVNACANNDGAVAGTDNHDSGYGEVWGHNACILDNEASSVNPYSYGGCVVANGSIVTGTIDMTFNNTFFTRNGSLDSLNFRCGKKNTFNLEEYQKQGYDIGSTIHPTHEFGQDEILRWARGLLYPLGGPFNDDPSNLPWIKAIEGNAR